MSVSSFFSSYATQVVASIIIAVIGFVLGSFRRTIVHRIRTRRTRKYWEPFRARGLALVLGSYVPTPLGNVSWQHRPLDTSALHDFEPFGLVGFGDVLALMRLQEHLKSLSWHDIPIAHSKDIRSVEQKNLVLIGGPDPNAVTDLAMQHSRVPVVFEETANGKTQMRVRLEPGGQGKSAETVYTPSFSSDVPPRLTRDFGFVAQLPSPYAEDAKAILLVGVYGAGTAAAAHLVTSAYGVSRMMRLGKGSCITVFHTDIGRSGDISTPRVDKCELLPD